MNGIDLIKKEREEQIEKHGFDATHDDVFDEWQLKNCAVFALTDDPDFFPTEWDENWMLKIRNKPYKEQLIIAGALIAAEIDRVQRGVE